MAGIPSLYKRTPNSFGNGILKKTLSLSFDVSNTTQTSATYTATNEGYVIFDFAGPNASSSGYNIYGYINNQPIYRDQNSFIGKSNCYNAISFLINKGDQIKISAQYNLANNTFSARIYEKA